MNPLARALALSAVLMFALAIVLAVTVGALWGAIAALVGISDLALAALLRAGVLGTKVSDEAAGGPDGEDGGDGAAYGTLADGTPIREDDNPLARED